MRKEAVPRQIALENRLIADVENCIASQLDCVEIYVLGTSTFAIVARLFGEDT